MWGVRGQDEDPASYRTDLNWIGARGCVIAEASFVPIAPGHLSAGMQAWAQYRYDEVQPDAIVQLTVARVAFEALRCSSDRRGSVASLSVVSRV